MRREVFITLFPVSAPTLTRVSGITCALLGPTLALCGANLAGLAHECGLGAEAVR